MEVPHLLCELMITWNNSSKEFLFEEHTLIAYKTLRRTHYEILEFYTILEKYRGNQFTINVQLRVYTNHIVCYENI